MGVDTLAYINIKDLKKLISENFDQLLNLIFETQVRWQAFLSELRLDERVDIVKPEDLKEHLATYNGVIRNRDFWYQISNLDIIFLSDINPLADKLDSDPNYIELADFYFTIQDFIKAKFDEIVKIAKQK